MKKFLCLTGVIFTLSLGFSQDIIMESGVFNRCAPDKFFDSGSQFGNYGNDENTITTICPVNTTDFIIVDFTSFATQLNVDVLTVYDGDDTSAPQLLSISGPQAPFTVSASDTNPSGCLTFEFNSDNTNSQSGWEADILCAAPCQDIVASLTTVPEANSTGTTVLILPNDPIEFNGSGTFSVDDSAATYSWDFGDASAIETGAMVSHAYVLPGTYTATLTVSDDNPQGCSDTATIEVIVLGPNIQVDQDSFTIEELVRDVLIDSPCAEISNIISSTGIDFNPTNPNGIGYFFSNGALIQDADGNPFTDGVLITSGEASDAGGPNSSTTLSQSGSGWPGDPQLNPIIGDNTNNASFIQFDFVPTASEFSFDFFMASEEYNGGNFECTFSDVFAFFLTDNSTGTTTNLAIIPGTTLPITVTNIHLANAACAAANPQFFGGYTPTGYFVIL